MRRLSVIVVGASLGLALPAEAAPPPTINGDIVNNAGNIPPGDICQGDFNGAVTVTNGGTVVIGGSGCAP